MEPDDYPLRVGDTFASNTDLQTYMTKVIDDTGELFTKLRSDKLYPSHFKNASLSESEIDNFIKKLEYLRITYKCKYGAPTQKSKQNVVQKKRNTSTFNHDCPSYIKLHKIQKDGEFLLEVYETDFNHKNHPANSKKLVNALPERRRLPLEVKNKIIEYLKLKSSNKMIRNKIRNENNIFVLSKDISNIAQSLRISNGNNLEAFHQLLQNRHGFITKIKVDSNNKFQALYFTNTVMQKSVANWPEILFIDGTYKLFNLGFTLYLIVVQNGNGRGEIGGASVTASESADNLEWIAKKFRETNEESCKKTTCIMTDKDLTERNAFARVFPYVKFLLCLFHTLKTFDRILKAMKLTPDERSISFQLLRQLAYAKQESRYSILYKKLITVTPKCVVDYFNVNWHRNREEWTLFGMAEVNYGSTTNNLVESINKQVKSLCNKYSTLCEFGVNFIELIQSSKQETSLIGAIDGLKKLNINHNLGKFVNDYADVLTKTAFNKFKEEIEKHADICIIESFSDQTCKMTVNGHPHTCSAVDCSCYFRRSWKLPCVHILAVRKNFSLSLFCSDLCEKRWLKRENIQNIDLSSTCFIDIQHNTTMHEPPNQVFSSSSSSSFLEYSSYEKELIAQKYCNEIANIIAQSSNSDFTAQCEILKTLKSAWNQGSSVKLVIEEDKNNTHELEIDSEIADKSSEEWTNATLPTPIKLKGRSKEAMKTTSGYFCKRK